MQTQQTNKSKILIVSSATQPDDIALNEHFAASLSQEFSDEFTARWVNYNDIAFIFDAGKPQAFLITDGTPCADFDLVYCKSYRRFLEGGAALAECMLAGGVRYIGTETSTYVSQTKLSQYARLARHGFPLPKSIFIAPRHLADRYELIVRTVGTPFILKDIDGTHGDLNFLIRDEAHFDSVVRDSPEVSFVAQEFIANTGDLRVLVVGDEVGMVILRERADDTTHLNNTSQGAHAKLIPLKDMDPETLRLSEKAAKLFNREIAGVDIMFESGTNRTFLLEVNSSPQIATGAYIAEKNTLIGSYLARQAKS